MMALEAKTIHLLYATQVVYIGAVTLSITGSQNRRSSVANLDRVGFCH